VLNFKAHVKGNEQVYQETSLFLWLRFEEFLGEDLHLEEI
jgi:hypothetical protein